MDFKKIEEVGEFLANATPEELSKLSDYMTENAPHLMPVPAVIKSVAQEAYAEGQYYTNEECPQCGSTYYEEQLGMCTKCYNYIQQGGLHE